MFVKMSRPIDVKKSFCSRCLPIPLYPDCTLQKKKEKKCVQLLFNTGIKTALSPESTGPGCATV